MPQVNVYEHFRKSDMQTLHEPVCPTLDAMEQSGSLRPPQPFPDNSGSVSGAGIRVLRIQQPQMGLR